MTTVQDIKAYHKKREAEKATRLYRKIAKENPSLKSICIKIAVGREMNPPCSWFKVHRLLKFYDKAA